MLGVEKRPMGHRNRSPAATRTPAPRRVRFVSPGPESLRPAAAELAALAAATSQGTIAEALTGRGLDVTRQAVALWTAGDAIPSEPFRLALRDLYGIREIGWLSTTERRRVLADARAAARVAKP